MNNLDLFSGIGGFALGMEKAGFKTAAFCEIEPYCQKVLAKHWPEVPIYDDVKELSADRLAKDGIRIDTITGGFPCQDISVAGRKAGIKGERSGLWSEVARLIGELQPRYAIMENVTNLISGDRGRWFGRVLGDLAEIGYDAEWHCISASAIGAYHHRDRVWIIAYPQFKRSQRQGQLIKSIYSKAAKNWETGGLINAFQKRALPYVCREHDGISHTLDRIKGLGNAIVPQIAEIIGGEIMAQHNRV